jgi:hypothetical protein
MDQKTILDNLEMIDRLYRTPSEGEERVSYWKQSDYLLKELGKAQERMIDAERERNGWREAAYALGEALSPSWETLQPPAAQLAKFKEMVALQNERTKKLLDNADKHSKMYP